MPQTFLAPVQSVETVNFLEALAGAAVTGTPPFVASAMNNLNGVPAIGSRRFLIRAIQVLAVQNFGPEFNFFGSAAGKTTDPATDTFISRFGFTSAMGEQIGGAGLFRYYIDGLAIPYLDLDTINTVNPPTLHVVLQNIDTVAKSANAPGQLTATFWLEVMQSY